MSILIATDGSEILVDNEDRERLSRQRWWVAHNKTTSYAHTQLPDGRRVYMHRLITDAPDGMVVDHINCHGLDNRKSNLRVCTNADNSRWRRGNAGESGFRGVQKVKQVTRKPWRARIKANGKYYYLGYYETIEGAIAAYNAAAIKHFGEFARLHAA